MLVTDPGPRTEEGNEERVQDHQDSRRTPGGDAPDLLPRGLLRHPIHRLVGAVRGNKSGRGCWRSGGVQRLQDLFDDQEVMAGVQPGEVKPLDC